MTERERCEEYAKRILERTAWSGIEIDLKLSADIIAECRRDAVAGQWRQLKDDKPAKIQNVLFFHWTDGVRQAEFREKSWFYGYGSCGMHPEDWWRPLPEPPKEER